MSLSTTEWIESVLEKWPEKYKTIGEFMESPEGKEFAASLPDNDDVEEEREQTEDEWLDDVYDNIVSENTDFQAKIAEREGIEE
jgi:hypothetical protein